MLEGTKLEGFSPVDKVDEIQITDMQEGAGNEVKIGDSITAHYTGALAATGVIFQSSHDSGQPFTADLLEGQLIQGWIEGIPGMKAGGKRRIVIPAAKAYGEQGQNGIPANSDLVFDVELQAIN
ncbi:FKBP-type peptidyl-prolyl cis-trans isomerase [Candidatus Saccharibacteria bacterium]|nr:FKBP-type peptidyl-prolyl cis-trans isomerase [Candidatus Saccharibacteria bacterium]